MTIRTSHSLNDPKPPAAGVRSRTRSRLLWSAVLAMLILLSVQLGTVAFAVDTIGGVAVSDLPGQTSLAAPEVEMAAGVLMAPDGRELWAREPDAQHAMASTTKIMTAVVVLENAALEESVTVSANAASVGESAADLRAGDKLTVAKMLEALLVKSGNDAAIALAEHVAGSEAGFVEMMNAKAAELGLSGTHFTNSHGLDESGHHTTARDLGTVSRYAMAQPEFHRDVGLLSIALDSSRGTRTLHSSNELLLTYTGATGVKTGWTNDAGYCLVATAQRDEVELTAVVLGASSEESRFQQAAELLDWGFEHYRVQGLASAEETMGTVPVSDYLDVEVVALLPRALTAGVFDLDGEIERTVTLAPEVEAPVAVDQRIGTLSITQGDRLIAQAPIVAGSSVRKPGILEAIWIAIQRVWRGIFGEPAVA